MKFRSTVSAFAAAASALFFAGGFVGNGAHASSKRKAPETYAALDPSEQQAGVAAFSGTANTSFESGNAAESPEAEAPAPAAAATAPVVVQQPLKRAVAAKSSGSVKAAPQAFDAVPAAQAEPIISRLRIVEELIRDYGRAYDYRSHTLKELQAIRDSLKPLNTREAEVEKRASRAGISRAETAPTEMAGIAAAPAPAAAPMRAANDSIATGKAAIKQDQVPAPEEFDTTVPLDPEQN